MVGIGSIREAFADAGPVDPVRAADGGRGEAPEGAGKTLEVGCGAVEMRRIMAEPNAGLARRAKGLQWEGQRFQGSLDVRPRSKRIARHGIARPRNEGIREGQDADHGQLDAPRRNDCAPRGLTDPRRWTAKLVPAQEARMTRLPSETRRSAA